MTGVQTCALPICIVLVRHGRVVADGTAAQIRASVSGRTLRAALTGPAEQVRSALAPLAADARIGNIEILGGTLSLTATDTDAVAALLLGEHLAKDLEITSRGLEDAFIALTSDAPVSA